MVSFKARQGRPLRLAIVTNIPAPYRVPVYNLIAADPDFEFLALYAAEREPDRSWNLPPLAHAYAFLEPNMVERSGRYIHNNPDVSRQLDRFQPDVVLTTGFNPTHLKAWAYTLWHRCRHVAMTDGTDRSEASLSSLHKAVRHLVFGSSGAFVAASQGGRRLFRGYGVPDALIHFSPLCANTAVDWTAGAGAVRDIDLLFSARLVPGKNADFALRVARAAALRLDRRLHMAVLGSGPLEPDLRAQAAEVADVLDVQFAGHLAQADLPAWFHRSRVFLFPSSGDTWGVVANEACMAGVPVLVTPHAGVAGELVRHGQTGWVLPLDQSAWVDALVQALQDPTLLQKLSMAARQSVLPYSFENAAFGIMDAARRAHDPDHAPASRSAFV